MTTRRALIVNSVLAAALALTGCSASNPMASESVGSGETIVIGSANYPENVILGEIYAQALEDRGFAVERELNIGAREVLYSQIQNCSLDVVPEYNQALLSFVSPEATASGTEEVDKALVEALPQGLKALKSSPAEDNNAIAVTGDTAQRHSLKTMSDLAAVSSDMVIGGPTEWEARAGGYPALQETYGVKFKEYKVLDYSGPITLSALDKGDIDAALLFSTTPQIETEGYVLLEDPEGALGVNNVTPLICQDDVSDEAREVLNSISTAMTTDQLTSMNAAYIIDKRNADDVAEEWLKSNELN